MIPSAYVRYAACVAACIPAIAAADAVVTFNEVNYNPVASQDGEWIELYNQMAVNVDISGWKMANGIDYTFPSGTVIPRGGYLVVAKNPANPDLSGVSGVKGPFSGNLSNSGETIELVSRSGRIMDTLEYGDVGAWPIAADGIGATLAKRLPGTDSEKAASWTASLTPGGTPAAKNFPTPGVPIQHVFTNATSTWRFNDSNIAPSPSWTSTSFDDSAWATGQPLFGTTSTSPVLTVTTDLTSRYRAGAITGVSNGATFSQWSDSATDDGVSQNTTAGGNPTYRTNATFTGEPVVRFDGDDEYRASQTPGISASSGFVYFVVCKANAGIANGDFFFDRDSTDFDYPLASLKVNNNRYEFQKRDDSNNGLGGPISTTQIATDKFQIVAIRRNPSAARFEIWVDGVMEASTPDDGENLTPQPIVIGGHSTAGGSGGIPADIAELLIYRDALSESDFQSVGAYLEARYGLATAFPDTAVKTGISTTAQTSYFRKSFNFTGDPSRTQLRLDQTVADGAIFYLNGQEISRTNLPPETISHNTSALSNVTQPVATGFQTVPSTALVTGTNVLSVSLHKASGDDSALFSARLEATETPADPTAAQSLRLNEIAGTGDPAFFIELINDSPVSISTVGYGIGISGGASHALAASAIPAGGVVSFTEAQLGFRPAAGDKIVLLAPGSKIADVQLAAATPGGRGQASPGDWLRPSVTTPGGVNQFALNTDIVINEICYKAPNLAAVPGVPSATSTLPLISYGSTWRYNQTGPALPSNWASTAHAPVGGWQSGPGTLGYSTNASLQSGFGTLLTSPGSNNPFVITYYFETDFNLTAPNAATLSSLNLTHLLDDGAVFYLNGVELTRINMPSGALTSSTVANVGVATAAETGPITVVVPPGTAVAGTNRLSVEVHQNSTGSSDVVFGLQASATITSDPGSPAIPERASQQQWIELYNKGVNAVNLSGWKLSEGVTYTIPSGTTLAAGGYLLVAKDPALVSAASPVLGPWSGSLSGSGERVVLQDSVGNPADSVSYVDGGRWPKTADGGGNTLELRDTRSDNSLAESWAASNETARRSWQTFTYQGVASASSVGPDGQWREFIFGLLDEGEMLIDDITVTENPDGTPVSMISGGDFETGITNWRFLGNHSDARVVTDPSNASNHALYLRSVGATEHMHNHVEKTFQNGRSVVNGRTYRISFKARWISGCNKLNTRLYFNRLARTSVLARTEVLGTPGAANSMAVPNVGPGFTQFSHSPAVPQPGEPVTVTARAGDVDGLGSLTLHYSPAGGAFVSVPMGPTGEPGTYSASIPGFSAASVVRFYVAAVDAAGIPATSYFPAEGPLSHALYQVNDGLAATNGLHNIRIVMDPADKALLYRVNNLMSNGRIGCTVIYGENEVYYNAGVRLKSSQRGRQNSARVGFNLSFNDDQLFRGVHGTIAIDRSEGQITGAQEILYDHMMYASGGIPAECNDLVKVIAPDPAHTSTGILQMARFGSVFLDSQFEDGADGTVYEYELIYYPTTADANGYKLPQPDNVVGVGVTGMGDDKENYRWSYLTKNSEDKDDYSRIIAMTKLFDQSGAAFDATVNDVLDVNQWLRALAYSCASGAGDSFFSNSGHNGQFYARPSDGRVLYFPHDMDYAYNSTMPIFTNTELQKLTVNPVRRRIYLGNLHDICTTVFNQSYMSAWTTHYGSLLPNENFSGHLSYINTRSNYILSAINSEIAPVAFSITTNGGANFSTTDTPVALSGQGWVNVKDIRLAGSGTTLNVTWTSSTEWNTVVPINGGSNVIQLEALNYSGQVVGTDSITVTNSGNTQLPSGQNLVISEIYYHPLVNEDAEYLEFQNISSATLDMSGLTVTGIAYVFPNGSTLVPGARVVVVKNQAAFQAAFGTGRPVSGAFISGSLNNAGETLTLRRSNNDLVLTMDYSDDPPWPTLADTAGHSLILIDPFSNPDLSDPLNWRASVAPGGTPGTDDSVGYATWKAGYGNPADDLDADGDGLTTLMEYFAGGDPSVAESSLAPTYSLEAGGTALLSITRRADVSGFGVVPQRSGNLQIWEVADEVDFVSNNRIAGSPARERLTFRVPSPTAATRQFFRFAIQ